MADNPYTSIRTRAAQLGISRGSLQRILKLDLGLFPYKIQPVQQLHPRDYQLRLEYARAFLEIVDRDINLLVNLMMSDEVTFI